MALAALCEVVFHVDNGNQVDHCWPPGALSPAEQQDVAFSAFPDSLSCELRASSSVRDSCFSFRLRRRQPAPGAPEDLYGHVFCRARTDERLRRGCEQRSIVLLSHLPLFAVLEPLARLVGPAALSYGERALRQVWDEVGRWPPLAWGERMDLPLLGGQHILTVRLPMLTSLPASALPAAVAAALGGHETHQQLGAAAEPAAAAAAGDDGAAAGAAAGGSDAAAEGGSDSSDAAAPGPAVASPEQVAAALAAELDTSGLPVCLLPQAYGQQELEASPFGDCDCFTPLRASLQHLWSLWELLLLGEQPLLVLAPSPGACSAAVVALLSLLTPLPFSPDYRPYYTIHDPSFASLAAAGAAPSPASGLPLVLGATNLYLLKALPGWPNVLSTGYTAATLAPSSSSERLDDAGNGGGGSGGGMRHSDSGASVGSSSGGGSGGGSGLGSRHGSASWLGGALRRQPATPAALLSAPVDHCWLRHKPCVRPDKQLLQQLVHPQASDPADKWRRLAAVNSGIIRRHFQELTKALLFPLLRYLSPAAPPPPTAPHLADPKAAAAAPAQPPPLPALDPAALLEHLAGRDAILPDALLQRFGGQRGCLAFYEKFLRSPVLASFMATRRLAAEEHQRQEWAAAAETARAPVRELLAVEHFFRLERQLAAARVQAATSAEGGEHAAATAAAIEQLAAQLQAALGGLPSDLQDAIRATPSHAALLGASAPEAAAPARV